MATKTLKTSAAMKAIKAMKTMKAMRSTMKAMKSMKKTMRAVKLMKKTMKAVKDTKNAEPKKGPKKKSLISQAQVNRLIERRYPECFPGHLEVEAVVAACCLPN